MVDLPGREPRPDRFVALDSLRGISALVVVAYHLRDRAPYFGNRFLENGFFGVGFFFVLSGFVIAHAYGDKLASGFSTARFMLLRFGRVYPLHIAVIAVYLALEAARAVLGVPGMSERAPFTGLHSWDKLAQAVFLLQPFQANPANAYNWPAWSISVELIFYLVTAVLFAAVRRPWALFLPISLLAIVVISKGLYQPPLTDELLRGAAGFGAGVTCHALWKTGRLARPGPAAASLLEILAVGLIVAIISRQGGQFDRYWEVIASFAFAILVFAGDGGVVSGLLRRGSVRFVGRVSYSIYMVHSLVILVGLRLLLLADPRLGLGVMGTWVVDGQNVDAITGSGFVPGLIWAGVFAAVLAVSALTWRWIEEPGRQWARRRASALGAGREESQAPTI